jgi:3',5'-cyclic-AMP phosphodiesterase
MANRITRRKLLQQLGMGAVGASVVGCTVPETQDKSPVLRFAYLTDMHIKPGIGAEEGVKKCIDAILKNE